MMKKTFLLLLFTISILACKEKKESAAPTGEGDSPANIETPTTHSLAYIGTYTRKEGHVDGRAEGVYLLQRDENNGHLKMISTAAKIANPSFVAASPDGQNLYAVGELGGQGETGAIHVFGLDDFHNPTPLQELPTDAKAPCHVTLDSEGKYVFIANYSGGVVKMFKRDEKGLLSPADTVQFQGSGANPARQESSHPHSTVVSPDNRFLFVPDLGSDKVWIFKIDREKDRILPATQQFISTSPGAGPRHFSFHPNGSYAYVINELDNTILAFSYDPQEGKLSAIQTITTLPEGFEKQNTSADIHVHPNGKFLYGSNRGHNSIAMFSIDQETGKLSAIGHESTRGETPRNFAIHPSGAQLYAANQDSGNITQFRIDPETGKLTYEGELKVKTPVCIAFYP